MHSDTDFSQNHTSQMNTTPNLTSLNFSSNKNCYQHVDTHTLIRRTNSDFQIFRWSWVSLLPLQFFFLACSQCTFASEMVVVSGDLNSYVDANVNVNKGVHGEMLSHSKWLSTNPSATHLHFMSLAISISCTISINSYTTLSGFIIHSLQPIKFPL